MATPFPVVHQTDTKSAPGVALRFGIHREQIERERLLAVERINDTTQALSGWMWETDAEGRFVFMTDSVERLAGFKPE
jgi:PAS domain-containing protein